MLNPYKNNLGLWVTGHIHIDYDYQLAYNNNGIMAVRGLEANKDHDSSRFQIVNVYEVPTITGISTQKLNKPIKIFPNPNDGKFTIAEKLFSPNAMLKIYDVVGNLISEKEMRSFSTTTEMYQFDFSYLPKGLYYLVLTDETNSYSQQLMMQ